MFYIKGEVIKWEQELKLLKKKKTQTKRNTRWSKWNE